jgi:hypothetical protein
MRILILTICLFCAVDSLGCSCSNKKKRKLIKHSDFAVMVEVIEAFHRENYPIFDLKFDVKVRVLKFIKGKIARTDIVIISSVSGSCAEDFLIGKKYLVTGSNRIFDYLEPADLKSQDVTQDDNSPEINTDYTNLPRIEPYSNYIKRISGDFPVIFTDMCGVIRY